LAGQPRFSLELDLGHGTPLLTVWRSSYPAEHGQFVFAGRRTQWGKNNSGRSAIVEMT
jgi:hypothetical protein